MKKKLQIVFSTLLFLLFLPATAQTGPQLEWAKQFGGIENSSGYSVVTDASGNVYTSGYFEGTVDFDPGPALHTLVSAGDEDAYISKLDASGNLVWAKRIGGINKETNIYIDLDSTGNIYLVGNFFGTVDFNPGSATYNLTSIDLDVFIVKLDMSGNFMWAKQIEGSSIDQVFSIKADAPGNVYVLGTFEETADFDPGPNVFNLTSAGFNDTFICKLDTFGNFVWAKQLEGIGIDLGFSIDVDGSGNVYSTGFFSGTVDFDPGTAMFNLSTSGSNDGDIFISKLDASGDFVWAKQLGGTNANAVDLGLNVFVDASQNVYTTGYFTGTADFDPGAPVFNLTSTGLEDVFVCKLNQAGGFAWAIGFGGSGTDSGLSLASGSSGNIYVTGLFQQNVDFDPGSGTQNLVSAGSNDIFIGKFDNGGNFLSVTQLGGTGMDLGIIEVDALNNIYLTGFFENIVDFDPDGTSFNLTSVGMQDTFVLKLNDNLGITKNIFDQNIKLYPNPVSNKLNVSSGSSEIEQVRVFDFLGRKILEQQPNTMNTVLNMGKLTSGIYVVEITVKGKTTSNKIVKE